MACASPAARYRNAAGYPLQKLNESIGHNHWFLFVIVTAFIFTFLWSCFYFLQLKDSINMKLPFSWLKLVSLHCVIWLFQRDLSQINIIIPNVNFNRDLYFIGVVLYNRGNDPLCFGMDSASSWIRILCWKPRGNMWCTNCCRSEYIPIYNNKKIDKTQIFCSN